MFENVESQSQHGCLGLRNNVYKYKETLRSLSLIRDHEKKVAKQGRSPTPADILVDI